MKIKILLLLALSGLCLSVSAQNVGDSRELKKNRTTKEWKLKAGSKTPMLNNVTVYDNQGRKKEETEYASYGVKARIVYEYGADGLCSREIFYNDKGKVSKIRKYEYNSDGTKHKQYTYSPKGNLETTKTYEYSY